MNATFPRISNGHAVEVRPNSFVNIGGDFEARYRLADKSQPGARRVFNPGGEDVFVAVADRREAIANNLAAARSPHGSVEGRMVDLFQAAGHAVALVVGR